MHYNEVVFIKILFAQQYDHNLLHEYVPFKMSNSLFRIRNPPDNHFHQVADLFVLCDSKILVNTKPTSSSQGRWDYQSEQ